MLEKSLGCCALEDEQIDVFKVEEKMGGDFHNCQQGFRALAFLFVLFIYFFFTSYMQTVLAGSRSGNSSSTAQSFLLERKKERPIRHQYVLGSDEL